MKLHEIARQPSKLPTEVITVEPAGGIYGEFDVLVEYDYEPPSYTDHEPGNPSFREHHAASISLGDIKLNEKVYALDDDGEKTGKEWDKGFDATKLPGWKKEDEDFIIDELAEMLANQAERDREDWEADRYDDRNDYYDDPSLDYYNP